LFVNKGQIQDYGDMFSSAWQYELSCTTNLVAKDFISLRTNAFQYTGGAHGLYGLDGHNYYLNPLYKIELPDLFDSEDHTKLLDFLSFFCHSELSKISLEGNPDQEPSFYEDNLTPNWENFNTFLVSKKTIDIIFNPYSVSTWAFGLQIVEIPFQMILDKISHKEPLQILISKLV